MERQAFLTLTGHTHGGQTGINGRALFPIYEYMRGFMEEMGFMDM